MADEIDTNLFKSMKRAELQRRAKKVGIKANMKTEQLITALENLYAETKAIASANEGNTSTESDELSGNDMKPDVGRKGRQRKGKTESKVEEIKDASETETTDQNEKEDKSKSNKIKAKKQRRGRTSKTDSSSSEEEKPKEPESLTEQNDVQPENEIQKPVPSKRSGKQRLLVKRNKTSAPENSGQTTQIKNTFAQKRALSPAADEAPVTKRRRTVIPPKSTPTSRRSTVTRTPVPAVRKTQGKKSPSKTPKTASTKAKPQNTPKVASFTKQEKKIRRSTFEGEPIVEKPKADEDIKKTVQDKTESPKETLKPSIKKAAPVIKTCIPLPKFHAPKLTPGQTFNFSKMHSAQFQKMESIDDYLERKRKRIEALTGSYKKVKINASAIGQSTQARKSIETPANNKVTKPVVQGLFSPRPSTQKKEASSKGVSFQSTNLKPPYRLITGSFNTAGNTPGVRKSIAVTQQSRKSVGVENIPKDTRKSVAGAPVTPFKFCANPVTPGSNTKAFNLKASLERKLNYRPYTGKLKPLTEKITNLKPVSHIEKAKSELKNPKVTSRLQRQKVTLRGQSKRRGDNAMARRGLSVA